MGESLDYCEANGLDEELNYQNHEIWRDFNDPEKPIKRKDKNEKSGY